MDKLMNYEKRQLHKKTSLNHIFSRFVIPIDLKSAAWGQRPFLFSGTAARLSAGPFFFGLPTDFLFGGVTKVQNTARLETVFLARLLSPLEFCPLLYFCSYRGLPDPLSRRGRQLVLSCLARLILAICSRHRLFLSLELDWCAEACTNLSWI